MAPSLQLNWSVGVRTGCISEPAYPKVLGLADLFDSETI